MDHSVVFVFFSVCEGSFKYEQNVNIALLMNEVFTKGRRVPVELLNYLARMKSVAYVGQKTFPQDTPSLRDLGQSSSLS